MQYVVLYCGGPMAGKLCAYLDDPGPKIVLPAIRRIGVYVDEVEYAEVVYEREESELAEDHFTRTDQHAYRCVFNGIAKRIGEL